MSTSVWRRRYLFDQGSGSPTIPYGLNFVKLSFIASKMALCSMCWLSCVIEFDSAEMAEKAEFAEEYYFLRSFSRLSS